MEESILENENAEENRIEPSSEELENTEQEIVESKNQIKESKEVAEFQSDFSKDVLSLPEKEKQTLFDSLYSSFVNGQPRDTVLFLTFTKAFKLLKSANLLKEEQRENGLSERIQKLSSQERQILFDALSSAITNQNERDTVLHTLFWKAGKLLTEAGK
ncbi:hypothetical protein [Leptospira sanjuanensis]|uniref:hypothetical protein n=1 Tax=Leptospira sanjuanensis TaxID=2879643 RepID=UPI001EE9598D|nr:hypothetical protein [Leptospira sanjuanensis]MCG6170252.1 hypothetical protein [Leptospira sanjuanensis]